MKRIQYWIKNLKDNRWKFWAWLFEKHPKLYRWCDEHLPIDTLPF